MQGEAKVGLFIVIHVENNTRNNNARMNSVFHKLTTRNRFCPTVSYRKEIFVAGKGGETHLSVAYGKVLIKCTVLEAYHTHQNNSNLSSSLRSEVVLFIRAEKREKNIKNTSTGKN